MTGEHPNAPIERTAIWLCEWSLRVIAILWIGWLVYVGLQVLIGASK